MRVIARFGALGALAVGAFIILLGGTTNAASANLSGTWELNLTKSNFGGFPAPQSITRKITHEGVNLAMTIVQKGPQGEVASQFAYTTDGKPVTNKVQGGDSKGSAQWI